MFATLLLAGLSLFGGHKKKEPPPPVTSAKTDYMGMQAQLLFIKDAGLLIDAYTNYTWLRVVYLDPAETLLEELSAMQPTDPGYADKFNELHLMMARIAQMELMDTA